MNASLTASNTTAGHWFATAEAFEQLCIRARDCAEAGRTQFDRHSRLKLQHLCRIADIAMPALQGTLTSMLTELDAPLLRHLRISYVRAGTLNALRAAALIREELEFRGEALL